MSGGGSEHGAPSVDGPPFSALGLHGRKLLIVASSGGHLAEAMRIHEILAPSADSLIVTFRSPQSERLTQGLRVRYVPYVAPRDVRGVVRATRIMHQILKSERFDAVLSTGAAIALSALPLARARRLRCVYVESYARFDGPSTTGRLIRRLGKAETYTQHRAWASEGWPYVGDIAPATTSASGGAAIELPTDRPARIFVALGTISPYRFDALVDQVVQLLPADAEVTWQLGSTTRTDLPGRSFALMPSDEFEEAASQADLVITQGGVGTALGLVAMGKIPLMVPRRSARNEHVDDHQVQVCRDFQERSIALYVEVDQLPQLDLRRGATISALTSRGAG